MEVSGRVGPGKGFGYNNKTSDTLEHDRRSAHSQITRAKAAMDRCFGLVRPHQHDIYPLGRDRTMSPLQSALSTPLSASSIKHILELLDGNAARQFSLGMRREGSSM